MRFRTLIHIGYHKTASSFLQKEVFSSEKLPFNLLERELVIREIVKKNLFFFDIENTRKALVQNFDANKVNVISLENLVGNPHSGGYAGYDNFLKLKLLFPDAKIFVCIREQNSMILSTYKQYVKSFGTLSLKRYLHQTEKGSNVLPAFDLKHFCYDGLINTYKEGFGKENVLVLPFEILNTNAEQFLGQLFEFTGISAACVQVVNFQKKRKPAMPNLTLSVKRRYNRVFTRTRVNPHGWFAFSTQTDTFPFKAIAFLERKLGKQFQKKSDNKQLRIIDKAVADFYAESNRRTIELINVDLTTYNYNCNGLSESKRNNE